VSIVAYGCRVINIQAANAMPMFVGGEGVEFFFGLKIATHALNFCYNEKYGMMRNKKISIIIC
jgi:hypothetical protein